MGKTAFIFPGQGAQYPGMGKDIYENYEEAKALMDKADEVLGFSLTDTVFGGSEEELSKTEVTQPAILMTSIAMAEVLKAKGIAPDVVAGLSLGEYSALVASGAIDYSDAVELVRKRGIYMEEAVSDGAGAMAAILGLENELLTEIVESLKGEGVIEIANYNCPGQLVISGEAHVVEKAAELSKEKGAKRAVMLQVSGPFHTSMLAPAGEKLGVALDDAKISEPETEIYFNVNAEKISSPEEIKSALVKQVSNSVLWESIVDKMITEDGVDRFVEIGPGKTLTSFVKKINKKHKADISLYNIENLETMEKFLEEFNA
ncbi:malonyl CoA-acyl carrier protein transacylase [Andreesenia angusta]|uniref:Malonyl CoA-acyl carrier protein transacylase n=1 Tax=Andreesenia angusta TaxID=39480 RepID=A0A1S1V7U3_9FIRM|nr:ACP S-malonyltransferase [Andreesenia angusta]OHW62671.1 malonyl CoA-acyl carrier protein transacylase [Andreesenia angusta]